MKASDFYTVPKSEAGVRVPLMKPDGTESGEWLLVIGPDSKAFAKAAAEFNRAFAAVPKDVENADELIEPIFTAYVSKLVIGWSFEDEFTPAALADFMTNSPVIAASIPRVATDRNRFFGLASPTSTPGPTSVGVSAPEAQSEPQAASKPH